jgi:hypothetical protein
MRDDRNGKLLDHLTDPVDHRRLSLIPSECSAQQDCAKIAPDKFYYQE